VQALRLHRLERNQRRQALVDERAAAVYIAPRMAHQSVVLAVGVFGEDRVGPT
jgi:hypothetical protein